QRPSGRASDRRSPAMIDLVPLGDRGFLARFATEDDAARWAAAVSARRWPGVLDVVPAYPTVGVLADPDPVDRDGLSQRRAALPPGAAPVAEGRSIPIPVLYDGEDLPDVARRLGLEEGQVITAHCGQDYRVFAIGFLPGFPYAGYLPPSLSGL